MKKTPLVALAIVMWAGSWHSALAGVLLTPNFVVVITAHCPEGEVACDKVSYTGVSRSTGQTLTLQGKALMGMCADRVTPCRHLGWIFKHKDTTYSVSDDGLVDVTQGDKLIIEQQGKWVR